VYVSWGAFGDASERWPYRAGAVMADFYELFVHELDTSQAGCLKELDLRLRVGSEKLPPPKPFPFFFLFLCSTRAGPCAEPPNGAGESVEVEDSKRRTRARSKPGAGPSGPRESSRPSARAGLFGCNERHVARATCLERVGTCKPEVEAP